MLSADEDEGRHADEWAQNVVNAWGVNVQAGNADHLSDDFKRLLDLACRYRDARSLAENHREFNMLSDRDTAEEKQKQQAFLEAYKVFHDRHGSLQ